MKYAYINGIILSGKKDMKPVKGMTVLTDGSKITDIVPSDEDIKGYKVIDLGGKYLLPGLINMHVHLAMDGKPPREKKKPTDYKKLFKLMTSNPLILAIAKKLVASYAKTELLSGVTTLRTVGGVLDLDGRVRDEINSGRRVGPRMLVSNTGISVPHGHFAGSIADIVSTPEEAKAKVDEIASTHPDWIKLMITGGVMDADKEGEPGTLRMSPEIVKAAADEAHKLGFKVAAHVESPKGVEVALENGVDSIEHGANLTPSMIKLFKERKAIDICTISPAQPYAEFTLEESHALKVAKINGKIVMDGIISCAKTCLDNDIPVGLGNDVSCPFVTHYNFWRELYYFHRYAGVSNSFALYTATLRNAELLGLGDKIGSIEKGKDADMIAVEANPLDDLKALRNVKMVVTRGNLITHPHVKRIKEIDTLLDKYM